MKNLILFICCLIVSVYSFSQLPKGFELREVVIENQLVIVQKKKKMGVYSLSKNDFLVKPAKVYIKYYERNKCLFIADVKKGVEAFSINKSLASFNSIAKGNKEVIFGYHKEIGNFTLGKRRFKISNSWKELPKFSQEITPEREQELNKYFYQSEKFGLRIHGKLIEEFNFLAEGEESYVPLVNNWGEDSIVVGDNGELTTVYPPRDPTVQKTGVWSMIENSWLVAPQNHDVYWMNNHCFVFNGYYDQQGNYLNDELKFDRYRFEKNAIVETQKGITRNNQIPFDDIISEKVLLINRDSVFVVFEEEDKKGLMIMQLFNHYRYDGEFNQGLARFTFRKILDPVYDEIIPSGHDVKFYTKKDGEFNLYEVGEDRWYSKSWKKYMYNKAHQYDSDANFNLDGVIYMENSGGETNCSNSEFICLQKARDQDVFKDEKAFAGIESLNDSLLYVKHFEPHGMVLDPFLNQYGEDSMLIDENGDYVFIYPAPEPGEYRSGILNLKTYKWEVSPNYKWIIKSNNGYLLCREKWEKGLTHFNDKMVDYYDFKKNDGSYLFQGVSEKGFDENYSHLLIANSGAENLLPSEDLSPGFVYYLENGKIGLADLNKRISIGEPSDYLKSFNIEERHEQVKGEYVPIHYKKDHVYIDNNNVVFDNGEGKIEISLNQPFTAKKYESKNGTSFDNNVCKMVFEDSTIFIQNGEWYYSSSDTSYIFEKSTRAPVVKNERDFEGYLTAYGRLEGYYSDKKSYEFFELKNWSDEFLYVIDYKLGVYASEPFMDEYGEDSLDENGDYVYPFDPGYFYSGVYNKKESKWVVPKKYANIQFIDNLFYADKLLSEGTGNSHYVYDIYDVAGMLVKANVKGDIKEVIKSEKIQWFDYLCYWLDANKVSFSSYSQSESLDLNEIDELHIVDKSEVMYARSRYKQHWFYLIKGEDTTVIRPNVINEKKWFGKKKVAGVGPTTNLEFRKLNDSLVYIESYRNQIAPSFPYTDMWGDDSINFEGDVVYPEPISSVYRSGVYNLKTFKWQLNPMYRTIIFKDEQFIASLNDEQGNLIYHIYDIQGNLIEKKKKLD